MTTNEPQSKAIEVEVLPSEIDVAIVKYAAQTGLEKQSTETLVEAFRPIFSKAREAIAAAAGVAESVKDATCVREIMRSRTCRLALRKIRLESDETREKHKKHALLYGRAVDGFHNILMADLSPVETALKNAEDIAERAEAKRLADLKAAREAELVPLLDEPLLGNLADLSEADYMKKLSNAKLLRQAKLDAAAKVEADRKAKEEADRIERERIAAENATLKAEVEAREAAYKAEREATRQAVEKKLADERAEAARVAAEIKAKADAAAKAAAEEAARERAEIEAKAKAEAARVAEIAKLEAEKERQALLRKHAEEQAIAKLAAEKAAKERSEIEAKAKRDAGEAAKARAELAAKEKAEVAERARQEALAEKSRAEAKAAAAAPDKAKIKAFAGVVRTLQVPALTNAVVATAIVDEVERFAAWVESQMSKL